MSLTILNKSGASKMGQNPKTRKKTNQPYADKPHVDNHAESVQKDPYFIPLEKIDIKKGLERGLSIVIRTGDPVEILKTLPDSGVRYREENNSANNINSQKENQESSQDTTVFKTENEDHKISKDTIISEAANGGLVIRTIADVIPIINEFDTRNLTYEIFLRINLAKTSDYVIVLFPSSVSGKQMVDACKKNFLGDAFIIEKFEGSALLYRIDHNSPDAGVLKSGINYRCCRLGVHALFNDNIIMELTMKPSDILRTYNKFCNNQISFLHESLYPVNDSPIIVDNLLSFEVPDSRLTQFCTYHNIDESIFLLSSHIFRPNHSSFVTLTQNS